jgi:hypothetical protein
METPSPHTDSYAKIVLNLVGVLGGVVALTVVLLSGQTPTDPKPVIVSAPREPAAKPKPRPAPAPAPEPEPPPVEVIPIDRAAVAAAETALDEASRDRERAEARAAEAARRLEAATARATAEAASSRTLAFRVRDPSSRIQQATAKGGYLRAETDKLKGEITAILKAPRPKAKSIVDRNPVAKPADGNEYHFELRRNRVTFIDLDRLLELVKADAQLRIRLAERSRIVDSKVGPVGAFSLMYALGRSAPMGLDELMERHGLSYDLRGWEIVPEFEGRGETYEAARRPVSDFARAIGRLNPERATITMWIYPDGFSLYRKLRDDLHTRGFMIAARPLPDGMSIRGSPAGSLSAGQ